MSRSGTLVRDWRQASLSTSWSDAEGWWTPAIDAVADAILNNAPDAPDGHDGHNIHNARTAQNARAACESLGRHRAAAGVFLDEARADLMVAGRVAGLSSASIVDLVDGLTIGWVDRTLDTFFTSACVDSLTELATLPYLMARLSELYASAAARGANVSDEHAFVVVQVLMAGDLMQSETQMVVIQRVFRSAFGAGETLARIAPQSAVALVSRDEPGLSYGLGQLRAELEAARASNRIRRNRMWLERLPTDRDGLPGLIRQLND